MNGHGSSIPNPAPGAGTVPEHPAVLLQQALDSVERVDVVGLSIPELKHVSGLAGRLRARTDSVLCGVATEVSASGTTATAAGVLQSGTGMSTRDSNRMVKVADGLAEMPNVAERLADGSLTLAHANSLVDAAQSSGAAVVDDNTDLLDLAGEVPSDKFDRDAKRFAAQASRDRGEVELERQRRDRKASTFTDPDTGMGRLSADFDPIKFELIRQALDGHVGGLLRADDESARADADSGRTKRGLGRTMAQRRLDAVFELITRLDASSHEPLAADAGGCLVSTQLVIVADLGLIDGTNPDGRCEIPGVGPVPPSVLDRLSSDTRISGVLFSGDGQPLWLGRSSRRPNVHQRLAVAVRDRGCVECGAPMHRCEIHHVREWDNGGPTDIENLVALCSQHHRQLHGNHPNRSRSGGGARAATGRARGTSRKRSREEPPRGPSRGLDSRGRPPESSRGQGSRARSAGSSRRQGARGQAGGQEARGRTGDRPRGRTRGSSGRAVPGTSSESDDPDH